MKGALFCKNIFFIVPLLRLSKSDEVGGKEKEFGPVHNWPKYDHFGQISAVGVDKVGNVYVFHRGNRVWDASTFSNNNIFIDKDKGPILNETIIIIDHKEGSLIKKTGANLFYLPHGLTIDDDNNVWVTDVALHQIFKFPPIDLSKPSGGLEEANLTLGTHLEPGSDRNHFCKPTAVAVDKETKEFYVSDGYCNARLIKYDQFGNILLILGRPSLGPPHLAFYMLNVPHALALSQEKQTVFVADRENLRVVSYDFQSGKFKSSYAEELNSRVFSVAYSPLEGGLLYVLANGFRVPKMVAVYSVETGKLILSFSPKSNFTNPHDLALSPDGRFCYVIELNPYKVWKFKLDMGIISKLKHHTSSDKKINETPGEGLQEPVSAESKTDKKSNFEASSSFLAVGLVVSIVIISFLTFMFHYYKRKGGYRRYETRRLILDDEEDGVRLT